MRDVCRDNLLKQPGTEGQTNTHLGMEINLCKNLQTSSARAYLTSKLYPNNSCKSFQSRTETKTLTNRTNCQPRQCGGVGGLVDGKEKKETLNSGGKAE